MLSYLFLIVSVVIALSYVLLINYILSYWELPSSEKKIDKETSHTSLTFVIPARNESRNITSCLESILSELKSMDQEIEIIVIDDHSDDDTCDQVLAFEAPQIILLKLENHLNVPINAYKKAALKLGISQAKGDYIIQIDADCIVPEGYLSIVNNWITNYEPDMLVGPIHLTGHSVFQNFQSLDMLGMMAVTNAGIKSKKWFMANGANLVYKKRSFNFQDEGLASGDDIYAVQQLARENATILFLQDPNASIATCALESPIAFYRQRLRWATKNKYMNAHSMKLMMVIPYLTSVMICIGFLLLPFIKDLGRIAWVFLFLSKLVIDYIYLKKLSADFGLDHKMKHFGISSALHPIYLSIIGTLSLLVKRYEWKGRKVK